MLGPITSSPIECSQKSAKDKSEPVLVRLRNNMVLSVNKQKMIQSLVGQLAEVSGQVKVKAGTMKLENAKPIEAATMSAGDPRVSHLPGLQRTPPDEDGRRTGSRKSASPVR